jgi:hypothetical protein
VYPELAEEQQAQLHMLVEGNKEEEQGAQTVHQFFMQAWSKERSYQSGKRTLTDAQQ